MCWLPWNLEATTSWNPQSLSRPVMRLLLPFIVMYLCEKCHGSKFHCLLEQHFMTWFLHNTQLSSSIKQSPSSEANMSSPSQETPHILWKSTAIARACDQLLSWAISIQSIPPSHFLKIYFNVILQFMPKSSKWSFSLRFPHQNPVCTSRVSHAWYLSHASYSSWFYHRSNILLGYR